MDSFNSFFNNTNQNVQQDPFPLQPFAPTPNPRSRFPQNLSRVPGIVTSHHEPFFNINVLPPDNDVPLLDFPKSPQSQFTPDLFQSMNQVQPKMTQSQPTSLKTSLSIPNTLQVPSKASVHYKLGGDNKMQPRKKGYSVGTNDRESSDSNGSFLLPNRRSEGSPTDMGISKQQQQPFRKSFGATRPDRVASFEQQPKSMNSLQIPLSPKAGFEENVGEQILAQIEENQINTVSMLNEVSSKIKKRVEYSINETPVGKNRVFECICFMEKDKIGVGKGNSKQAAKTEAAKAAICTLVTKDIYANEGHAILLSIQKIANSQTGSYSPSMASKSNSRSNLSMARSSGNIASDVENSPVHSLGGEGDDHNYSTCGSRANDDFDNKADHMNDSPLYELNVIAKECFIEPKWTLSPQPDQNGEFEVELRFDKLLAYGKGKKKQDAKRDAAVKIIQQIRADSELNQRFNPKSKKQIGKPASVADSTLGDRHHRFFDEYTSYKIFEDSQNSSFNLKEDIKKKKQDMESYLVSLGQKCKLENTIRDFYYYLFKKISDYTSMAASSTKQILMHAPQHVADYINNTYLIPVGSFALGSIRADKLTADCIMIFEEVKQIEEADFMKLYQQALEECQILDNQSNANYTPLSCTFSIKTSDLGLYLEVATQYETTELKLNIYIFNFTKQHQKPANPSVIQDVSNLVTHVRQIYNAFEHSIEDLSSYRILLVALRIWRDKHNLSCLRSEILDILVLNEFLTNKLVNISPALNNCLLVLSTDEVLKSVLSRFGNFYEELHQEMSEDDKKLLQKVSSQSLHSIFQGNFAPIKFQ